MLPYETNADEPGGLPLLYDEYAAFFSQLLAMPSLALPATRYWNASFFDGDPETPDPSGGVDADNYVIDGLSPGVHTLSLLPDYAWFPWATQESRGALFVWELNYSTRSDAPGARFPRFDPVGQASQPWDAEALAIAGEAAPDDPVGTFDFSQATFVARAPGLYDTVERVGRFVGDTFDWDYRYTESYFHTGKYLVAAHGFAIDAALLFAEFPEDEAPDGLLAEQIGAGRYLLALDEYEGVRERVWGPGWFDVLVAEDGPDTGILRLGDLDWNPSDDGTWEAIGDVTIGLEGGRANLLLVRGGHYRVTEDALIVSGGTAYVVVDGMQRPLFTGGFSLSLSGAAGTIDASENLFRMAGLQANLSAIRLTRDDVRVTTDLDLPGLALSLFGIHDEVIAFTASGPQFETGVTLDLAKYLGGGGTPLRLLGRFDLAPERLQLGYDAFDDRLYFLGDGKLVDYPTRQGDGPSPSGLPSLSWSQAEFGIRAGQAYGKGTWTLSDLGLPGGWKLGKVELKIDTLADDYSGAAEFGLPSGGAALGAALQFGFDPAFRLKGIFVEGVLPSPGLPIASSGASLRALGAGASNLDGEGPIVWKGMIGIDWLKQVMKLRFDGESDFATSVSGKVKGGVLVDDLGIFGSDANPRGAVKFEGSGSLDWSRQTLSLGVAVDIVDVIKGVGSVTANAAVDGGLVTARGTASFEIPGSKLKAEGNFLLRYAPDDALQRYAAGWVVADNPLYGWLPGGAQKLAIGVRVDLDGDFDRDDVHVFGAREIPLYSSWIVDDTVADLMVTIGWEHAASAAVHTRVIVYDDLAKAQVREVIDEANYAAHGIAVIDAWSGPLGKVVYVAAPAPGLWDIEIVNPEGLGEITYAASTSLAPGSLSVDAVTVDGTTVTVDYAAQMPDDGAILTFFADDDAQGFDGLPIGTAAVDGAGQFTWDASTFGAGRYWLYAQLDDGLRVPLADYAAGAARVGLPPNAPPVLVDPLADRVVDQGTPFAVDAGASFDDAEDAPTYRATLASGDPLPAWLALDASTGRLAGVPRATDVGTIAVRVIAEDGDRSSVSDVFAIEVRPVAGRLISGTAGDDRLATGGGDDTVEGGAGRDELVFVTPRAQNVVTRSADGTVTIEGPQGVDLLRDVERAEFADLALGFDLDGIGGKAYRLYQAAFDRTPDAAGVGFWIHHLDRGFAFEQAAANFIASAEFEALYGANPTNQAFTRLLYRNVLNRDPDENGYGFWNAALTGGEWQGQGFGRAFSRAEVLTSFSESQENRDNVIGLIGNGFEYQPWAG